MGMDREHRLVDHQLWVSSLGADGHRAVFDGQIIDGVDFSAVRLRGIRWDDIATRNQTTDVPLGLGASFRHARLIRCRFDHTDLSCCDFSGAQLEQCSFSGSQLQEVRWTNVMASECNLVGACFDGAQLGHARLNACQLQGAQLWLALGLPTLILDAQCQVDDQTRLGHELTARWKSQHQRTAEQTQQAQELDRLLASNDELQKENSNLKNKERDLIALNDSREKEADAVAQLRSRFKEGFAALQKAKLEAGKQSESLESHQTSLKAQSQNMVDFVFVWLKCMAMAMVLLALAYAVRWISDSQMHVLKNLFQLAGGVLFFSFTATLALHILIGRVQRQKLVFSARIMGFDTHESLLLFASALDRPLQAKDWEEAIDANTELRQTFQEIKKSALAQLAAGRSDKDDESNLPLPSKAWTDVLKDFTKK